MRPIVFLAALMLASCALTPEQKQAQANRYCDLEGSHHWTSIAPPANAQAYRDLGEAQRYGVSRTPHQEEFWFSSSDGLTRLCIFDPRPAYSVCSGGQWDFRETESGLQYVDGGEWICVT